jgi:outer membrane protein assembly factor BamB
LNAESGNDEWSHETDAPIYHAPAAEGNKIYVTCGHYDSYVYALNASSGGEIWREAIEEKAIIDSPSISQGILYFRIHGIRESPGYLGFLYAFDANTGQKLWKYQTGGGKSTGAEVPPALDGKFVYYNGDDAVLHVIDKKTGQEAMNYKLSASPDAVILENQTAVAMIFSTNESAVYALGN